MIDFIAERTNAAARGAEKETERFRAFFEFLRVVPEFLRILNEAEVFAPSGYQRHLDNIATAYVRTLKRDRNAGDVDDYTDQELGSCTSWCRARADICASDTPIPRAQRTQFLTM